MATVARTVGVKVLPLRTARLAVMKDVHFETSMLLLGRALRALKRNRESPARQSDLCRALRLAKVAFFDVLQVYGTRYQTRGLLDTASEVERIVNTARKGTYPAGPSVLRHVAEIRRAVRKRAG
ncbi:hypothetical protein LCGC14_2562050 [marine sediment metagenome]|uniref:Uncharacterized protein n=1 Tax=marine sediment metagenome TaxID=412755 RepID=A0A0F9AJT3_9ZZZZ